MGEWYLFSIFVFLLAAALVWLVKRTPRSVKKREDKSFEREAKLFKLYQNIEDLMDGFEEYVEDVKGTMRQETLDLTRRVDALEAQMDVLRHAAQEAAEAARSRPHVVPKRETNKGALAAVKQPGQTSKKTIELVKPKHEEPAPAVASGSGLLPLRRNQKVMILYAEGMEPDLIAKELGLSKNEVALVLKVEKRAAMQG